MKKIYVSPVLLYVSTESSQMICASQHTLTGGAQWGAEEGEYSPGEWVNQGQNSQNVGGYTASEFGEEDDDEDIPSRAKGGSMWDW